LIQDEDKEQKLNNHKLQDKYDEIIHAIGILQQSFTVFMKNIYGHFNGSIADY